LTLWVEKLVANALQRLAELLWMLSAFHHYHLLSVGLSGFLAISNSVVDDTRRGVHLQSGLVLLCSPLASIGMASSAVQSLL
jgi:hypothetical protein